MFFEWFTFEECAFGFLICDLHKIVLFMHKRFTQCFTSDKMEEVKIMEKSI